MDMLYFMAYSMGFMVKLVNLAEDLVISYALGTGYFGNITNNFVHSNCYKL